MTSLDIAVAAPYAATENPNATGVVYVYFGNDRGSISTTPGQVRSDIVTESDTDSHVIDA